MRFLDMVLTSLPEDLETRGCLVGGGWCSTHNRPFEHCHAYRQHEADMAAEVACPCRCHGQGFPFVCAPTATNGPQTSYCICSGRGRVTLGRIVEADRARKVKP